MRWWVLAWWVLTPTTASGYVSTHHRIGYKYSASANIHRAGRMIVRMYVSRAHLQAQPLPYVHTRPRSPG